EDDNSSAVDDNESFASVDDLDADEEAHKMDLESLKEVDPKFYKYLQENDKELLEFGNEPEEIKDAEDVDVEVDEAGIAMEEEEDEITVPSTAKEVMKEMLHAWQRRLLLAFRVAVHMNEEDGTQYAYSIGSSAVYNKLVVAALKYTSIVLSHHLPYKTLPDRCYKPPAQTKKHSTLQKMTLSFFGNVLHLLSQLPDGDMKLLILSESTKVIPYIVSSRKVVKDYLKQLLAGSMTDLCLSRPLFTGNDGAHLPSINLMKNSAMELYTLDHEAAYQHAFRISASSPSTSGKV
ncbi:hypothetical protein DACRYDRAFT_20741, partial [Dacryopinax primogenitus]